MSVTMAFTFMSHLYIKKKKDYKSGNNINYFLGLNKNHCLFTFSTFCVLTLRTDIDFFHLVK